VNIDYTEFQTFVLGPYGSDPYEYTLPCLPQVRSGHTKVFPPRATLGPPDADVDDTLSTVNWQDLTGGQGISIINPSTDLNRYWWGTADTRGTDGWTNPPEAIARRPSAYSGNFLWAGRIGVSIYGLWGSDLHLWDADGHTWGAAQKDVGTIVGDPCPFDDKMFFPLGTSGYSYISESSAGTLAATTTVAGAATPAAPEDDPTTNPKVLLFAVYNQNLWAVTTKDEGYVLCSSVDGATNNWFWPYDRAREKLVKVNKTMNPQKLVNWLRPDGQRALYLVTEHGVIRYNSNDVVWEETNLVEVPPHPNFGRDALPWRPGEDLWIAGGGGDVLQFTASNVIQPGNGPGGRGNGLPGGRGWSHGMPASKRGDIVSMTSDLSNMYVLIQGDTTQDELTFIEDASGSDALYVPESSSQASVVAYTGKGWVPLWETSDPAGTPTRIRVAYGEKDDGTNDYRLFWGLGEDAWDMPCRLTTYSSRQGRERGIDRFQTESYIEFGEFNAGSIANYKWWSHAAILMDHGSSVEYAEFEYMTDDNQTWTVLGSASNPRARTVLPFGLTDDSLFAEGISSYWIKPRLRLVGGGGVTTPTVQALSLSYLTWQQDAAHFVFTIPLPVETNEWTNKTREQIHDIVHDLLEDERRALFMQFGENKYRVLVAGASHTEIAGQDFVGAITLNLIQVPSNAGGLIGE
jgi:hypothetical protein